MTLTPTIGDRRARVLIVDDELHNRQLLEVMLKLEGLHLLTAASGEEALAMVAKQPPDLILLDVMMPGMDGYQVTGRIKGSPATRNIPVVLVTAMDDRNARMIGLSAGAEDFLTKPVDRAELCVRVRNLLRLKAYVDSQDKHSHLLEEQVSARTAELRDERDRAQRYLDAATVILIGLDTQGRITVANRFACSVLEWTEDELIGRDWFDTCLVPRIRTEIRNRFLNLISGDVSISENTILTRSGIERIIEWRSKVVRDNAGLVIGTFSSGTDVTDRTQAVEALRTTEERMRFALEAADVGVWDIDYTTGIERWSETMEIQHSLQPGTFGKTFESFVQLIHPDDRESVLATVEHARKTGEDFSIEYRAPRPDGSVRWLSGGGRILLGEDGLPMRGVGISQDVTERRSLERQYQQAQKMEAVGQLASGVAHDFNNLLTVIIGFAELVGMNFASEDQHSQDLSEIIKAAKRGAGLTKQLLAFSRKQMLHAAPLDVNVLITDMTGMLVRLIGEHIEISLALAPSLSLALVDRSQLEQVVMNLVVNARDAMPDGGSLSIETRDVELDETSFNGEVEVLPQSYVMLAITDTGTGMTKEIQRRIYEPFFTTKDTGKGTGLGLSTTYGIIKQSKGYIWVYSELGVGTTFEVYLPRSDRDIPVLASDSLVTPVRASGTVLLVEDEAGVRELGKRILERAGYRVFEASNGNEAEKVFTAHGRSIDLIVTDVIMPGCDGPELISRLQVQTPGIRVLYMSGYTEQSSAHKASINRGIPLVQKPFTATEFLQKVRGVLEK